MTDKTVREYELTLNGKTVAIVYGHFEGGELVVIATAVLT